MVKIKFLDIVVLVAAIILAAFSFMNIKKSKGNYVQVNANGTVYEYSLKQNGTYTFEGAVGKTVMEIKDGQIRFTESACPNKTCIAQGFSNTIVCLPNKVIATINGSGDLDAVAE